ncbi:DUF4291 domain-containing protein [Leptospira wolffii]|uniref:DUF4291 domain-containing protein n=1 Tax=Leptospira wolffii TaxID=409998 RepID=UPI00058DD855|nr:DUF4291 domain-containing protein [Leptospira wolffii]
MEQIENWPNSGRHILAQYSDDTIIIYQAFHPEIAKFAVSHQKFGGPFSLNRMSWIKPNFLWMMYRCGWASKAGQERVLAIRLQRAAFETILSRSIPSVFTSSLFNSEVEWHKAGVNSDVRIQWDPDHDPFGRPLSRRAIQLGLRGATLQTYAKEWILEIEDITEIVIENREHVFNKNLNKLICPYERVYELSDETISRQIYY